MKKAALLLAALLITQASFAYVEEYTTTDNKTLQGTGYSQELLELVDTKRMLLQGSEKDYVPFYSREIYSKNPALKWYQIAKRYFDPGQDEHVFGVREFHYQNGFFDMSPSYSQKDTPNDKYQRLLDKDIKRLNVAGKKVSGSNGIEPDYNSVGSDIETSDVLFENL